MEFFSNVKNNLVTTIIDNVAKVKPVLTSSKFLKEGVLTAEEVGGGMKQQLTSKQGSEHSPFQSLFRLVIS